MSKSEREKWQFKIKLKKLENEKWHKITVALVIIGGTLLILTALFTI